MKTKREAKAFFRDLVEDDYTQLGFLTAFIIDEVPDLNAQTLKDITKQIIKELIEEDNIYVIDQVTELRAELSTEQIMTEIDIVFAKTNGKPRAGDGMWFGMDY